jgi:ABC-type multidrug transport system fused ATPase/permease subunit
MNKKTHKDARELFEKMSELENKYSGKISEDVQKIIDDTKSSLSGIILSSWLPEGWGRKIIMLLILFVAIIYGGWFLLLLIILPLFSPRVVAYIAIFLGRMMGNK